VHPGKTWIQGSNPCVSAKHPVLKRLPALYFFLPIIKPIKIKTLACDDLLSKQIMYFANIDMTA
jgi:hypothetical protein